MVWLIGSVVGLSAETLGFELATKDLAFVTQPGTGTELSPGTSVFFFHTLLYYRQCLKSNFFKASLKEEFVWVTLKNVTFGSQSASLCFHIQKIPYWYLCLNISTMLCGQK